LPRRATTVLPRYEEIAMDVASRVVAGEYRRGDRLFGRSSLAGLYKVSPETIRRAVALLHSRGVVRAVAGSGILVESVAAASRYLEESRMGAVLIELEDEIQRLLAERKQLESRLEEAITKVLHFTSGTLATVRHVEEIVIAEGSPLVGATLTSAELRARTGVTVVGIARAGEEIFSPDPTMPIQAGDLLIVVGTEAAKERLRQVVGAPPRGEEVGAPAHDA
jgi:K+/H+ antiporter YhaU regulatory subunit KhtT